MVVAVLVTMVWLNLIIGARYLLVAGGVWQLTWGTSKGAGRRLNRERPSRRRLMLHEIRYSLLSTPIYAFPAAAAAAATAALEAWKAGGTKLYLEPRSRPLGMLVSRTRELQGFQSAST